jgi:DNA-binding transcriptional ArsR family regulator
MKNSIAKYEAFHEQIISGKALNNAIRIYNNLSLSPKTIHEMRKDMKISHQTLTATLSMLEDAGWVYKNSTTKIDGKSYTIYKAELVPDEAHKRATQMEAYKNSEWIKRGIRNGWISTDLKILPLNEN